MKNKQTNLHLEEDPSGKNKLNNEKLHGENTDLHWSKPLRLRWTITYFIGTFFVYCVRSAMSICAPAIAKEMGWNKQTSGMALSAFFCGYVSTNIIGGYLADRHGGERMIIYSATVWSACTLLLPFVAENPTFLYSGTFAILGARFFTGMAQGFYFPSQATIFAKHVPVKERGFVSGFSYSGSSVGTIMTGFVGSLIIEMFDWEMVFIVIGIPALLWVFWMRRLYNSTTKSKNAKEKKFIKIKEPVPWRKLAYILSFLLRLPPGLSL